MAEVLLSVQYLSPGERRAQRVVLLSHISSNKVEKTPEAKKKHM